MAKKADEGGSLKENDEAKIIPAAEVKDGKGPVFVVGIGASAGGIEALGDFIAALPEKTGMSFVLVQHLDPAHESMLNEIFQRKTHVSVQQAVEGMVAEPDHIYIIPPNRHIKIIDGKFALTPRETGKKFMPIDEFFNSLARTWGNRSIGVVLSGTGNDGTHGVRAIQMEGGLTFAQDEHSAAYPDMPKNAAASGSVDFVLPPDRIALELARIGRNPLIVVEARQETPEHPAGNVEEEALSTIYRMLRSATGTDFANYKASTIRRRFARRMMMAKVETVPAYLEYLKKNPDELEELSNDLFINVTSFFRDPEIFDLLRESLLPDLIKNRHADAPVRVWIPGCSTGEEVYSLAICLIEAAGDSHISNRIQIFATDISERVVEKARSGVYPESIEADVSKERLRRFFIKTDGGYQISKSIRDACVFARQDLTRDPPFSRIDLISCRNLLIYLSAQQQKKIIPTFHYSLNNDGILVLGSSESVGGFGHLFNLVDKKYKIYRKKQGLSYLSQDFVVPPSREERTEPDKRPLAITTSFEVEKEADRIVLSTYAPAAILVNDQLDIVQFRGDAGRYVVPSSGAASLNLTKMLRDELLLEIRSMVSEARNENITVHRSLPVALDGQLGKVEVNVVPVRPPETRGSRHFLIVLKEVPAQAEQAPEAAPSTDQARELQQEQMRHDLQATREYLQSVLEEKDAMNEEFRSAMEEIQSSNEELQSTNEELETTKEELQSTNEELMTVNEEMQNRNVELSRINDDLANLLNNVSLPLVILTSDLRIRRYTSMAESILSLIPSDVGRPFSDLRTKVEFPDLEDMFQEVLDHLAPQEREAQDHEGRWHKLRVRPFMTHDKKIDGLVLTMVDIDEMKQAMMRLQSYQHFSDAVIQTIREPLLVLNPDLRVALANRAFYRFFEVTPAETEGNYVYNLGKGQWNVPELRRLLEGSCPRT